jgi:hypothetical protein
MSAAFTLEYDGDTRPLDEWGLTGLRRVRRTQDADELTFVQKGALFDADPLFAFEGTIKVYRDGVKWFEGVVMEPRRSGGPLTEDILYTARGPWHFLDRVFQQYAKTYDNALQQVVNAPKSHCLLGWTLGALFTNPSRLTVKGVIEQVLDYAIAGGAPFQYDTSHVPDLLVPVYEVKDATCVEAIRIMLRWFPDMVTWFDYSTTPPTLHLARRADLAAASIPASATVSVPVHSLQIEALRDLQRSAVVLKYEVNNVVNGQGYVELVQDKHPPGATGEEWRAFTTTINLQGYSATFATATVETEDVNAADGNNALRNGWWSAKQPWLAADDIFEFNVREVVRQSSYPRELTSGQLAAWMPWLFARETITAIVDFEKVDGTKGSRVITHSLTVTNATAGTYSAMTSYEGGEDVPEGLAEEFYNAVNTLHYRGQITFKQQEVGDVALGMGQRLNLTGGRAEWTTMDAIVWETLDDLDAGETTVSFGPAENLGIPDLLELLKVDRQRFTWTNPALMLEGRLGNANEVQLGEAMPRENEGGGVEEYQRLVVTGPEFTSGPSAGGRYTLDANLDPNTPSVTAPPPIAPGTHTGFIHLREIEVCVTQPDGSTRNGRMVVLGSNFWYV